MIRQGSSRTAGLSSARTFSTARVPQRLLLTSPGNRAQRRHHRARPARKRPAKRAVGNHGADNASIDISRRLCRHERGPGDETPHESRERHQPRGDGDEDEDAWDKVQKAIRHETEGCEASLSRETVGVSLQWCAQLRAPFNGSATPTLYGSCLIRGWLFKNSSQYDSELCARRSIFVLRRRPLRG